MLVKVPCVCVCVSMCVRRGWQCTESMLLSCTVKNLIAGFSHIFSRHPLRLHSVDGDTVDGDTVDDG